MRGRKMSVFVHPQSIKIVHAGGGGGGQKMANFSPRSYRMTPNPAAVKSLVTSALSSCFATLCRLVQVH